MPDDNGNRDTSASDRDYARAYSADRGNIRYGTESGGRTTTSGADAWRYQFRRQANDIRRLFRSNNRNGSR